MGLWRDQLTAQQQSDVDVLEYDFDQIVTDMLLKFTVEAVQARASQAMNKIVSAGIPTDMQNTLIAEFTASVDAAVASTGAATKGLL